MRNKLYWGIATLIVLLIAVGGFVFVRQWQEIQELKQQAAQDKQLLQDSNPPIVSQEKPITIDDLPAADEGFKWVQHGDHFHQVPMDAPDEWQGGPHEPNVEISEQKQQEVKSPDPGLVFAGEVEISQLPELPADIDPDDIPAFYTVADSKVSHYNRPLTVRERAVYESLKASPSYSGVPAQLKMAAIILVRQEKKAAGELKHIFQGIGSGTLTGDEGRALLDEFYEVTRY